MLGLIVDRASDLSLTAQLCQQLRQRVLDGSLASGTKVPSSRALARDLRVARNVVIEVYEQLTAEGYLQGTVGSGTYVTPLTRRKVQEGVSAPPRRRPQRSDLVDFSSASGTPELRLFPLGVWMRCQRRAWTEATYRDLDFGDPQGDGLLREAVASMLFRQRGIRCSADALFITTGITQAFGLALQFLRPHHPKLILENPSVASFRRLSHGLGFDQELAAVDDEGLAVETLTAGQQRSLVLVTPAHQFPTGGLLSIQRRLALLDLVPQGYVLEDDYDGETRFRGIPVAPMVTLDPQRVFYAGTFNKTLFPSLQVGYLLVPPRLVEGLRLFRMALSVWSSTIHQRALALFVQDGGYDRHLTRLKATYAARRAVIEDELAQSFGSDAAVWGSETGAHVRVVFSEDRMVDWAQAKAWGVQVSSIGDFLTPRPARSSQILLGYGNLDADALRLGLRRLRDFLGACRA